MTYMSKNVNIFLDKFILLSYNVLHQKERKNDYIRFNDY